MIGDPIEKPRATGIEAMVCADIARRQAFGRQKYPTELAHNHATLSARIRHAYEERLDDVIYTRWALDEAIRLEGENNQLKEQNARLRQDVADLNERLAERTEGFLRGIQRDRVSAMRPI